MGNLRCVAFRDRTDRNAPERDGQYREPRDVVISWSVGRGGWLLAHGLTLGPAGHACRSRVTQERAVLFLGSRLEPGRQRVTRPRSGGTRLLWNEVASPWRVRATAVSETAATSNKRTWRRRSTNEDERTYELREANSSWYVAFAEARYPAAVPIFPGSRTTMHHFTRAIVLVLVSACSNDTTGGPSADASVADAETGGHLGTGSGGVGNAGAAGGGTGGQSMDGAGNHTGGRGGASGAGEGGQREAGTARDAGPDATSRLDASADAATVLDATLADANSADAPSDAAADAKSSKSGCTSVAVGTTFSAIYANLLSVQCVPCHTQALQGTGSLPLQFPPNQAFNAGVNVAYADLVEESDGGLSGHTAQGYACGSTGLRRVVPGDPDHSLLVLKLEGENGTSNAICGARMPFQRTPICQPVIDGIRTWIANGAHKD